MDKYDRAAEREVGKEQEQGKTCSSSAGRYRTRMVRAFDSILTHVLF